MADNALNNSTNEGATADVIASARIDLQRQIATLMALADVDDNAFQEIITEATDGARRVTEAVGAGNLLPLPRKMWTFRSVFYFFIFLFFLLLMSRDFFLTYLIIS